LNEVRIISGKWRRRKLAFPSRPTLRPTPDRARETVFNWLAPWIDGARCLDLFAGSGALGFEALSRGAAEVTLIDDDPVVIRALQASARTLDAVDCTIRKSRAVDFLRGDEGTWDIVFLDPPFASDLLESTLHALEAGPRLHAKSIVYVESSAHDPPQLDRWETIKTTRTGDVQSTLVTRRV
jgi:16S rRNA (guanine966-N2)-methyltransferase